MKPSFCYSLCVTAFFVISDMHSMVWDKVLECVYFFLDADCMLLIIVFNPHEALGLIRHRSPFTSHVQSTTVSL